MSDRRGSRLIFLSHSGRDKDLAVRISLAIRDRCVRRGFTVNVFNTSDPHYRFTEREGLSRAGIVSGVAEAQYKEKLRAYLSDNLAASSGYMLLVTNQSLAADSEWVQWEIQEGTALATKGQGRFLPILVNIDPRRTDAIAPGTERFQVLPLDINKPEELSDALRMIVDGWLAEAPKWRRAFRSVSRIKANLLRNPFSKQLAQRTNNTTRSDST